LQEWRCDDISWGVDPEVTVDVEADQESPSLFYDRTSGDMYLFSVDTGTHDVERHYKPSGGSWQSGVIADGAEGTEHSYPISQMHGPPAGSGGSGCQVVWAHRVVNGVNYDLHVGNLTIGACGFTYLISGTVFEDTDFAGIATNWDGGTGDTALPYVDVELYTNVDAYISSSTTDASGSFTFTGLPDGTYKVRVRSATLGDADTPPTAGLNATVSTTWPYPLPEMIWAHTAALIGGQDPAIDDTATADNAGPGDTYVVVAVSGADVTGANFGFGYELIVNEDDDANADNIRSKQGSFRQFIKNSNAVAGVNRSWFQIPGL